MAVAPPGAEDTARARALEVLRRRFLDGLAERWLRIEAAADHAARIGELHRLAGAAGSYGLPALDAAARAALAEAEANAAASDSEPRRETALREVRRAIEAAQQT